MRTRTNQTILLGSDQDWIGRAPMSPKQFREKVSCHKLVFTHKEDQDSVVELQRMVFAQKVAATQHLHLSKLLPAEVLVLSASVPCYTMLTNLSVTDSRLSEAGATALASSLAKVPLLKVLALERNRIGDVEAKAPAEVVHYVPHVRLTSNLVGLDGVQALAQVLVHSAATKSLSLADNRINCGGAWVLANAIAENQSLTSLNLESNAIETTGIVALVDALAVNTCLRFLNLNKNYLGDDGAVSLAAALQKRVSGAILRIELDDCGVGAFTPGRKALICAPSGVVVAGDLSSYTESLASSGLIHSPLLTSTLASLGFLLSLLTVVADDQTGQSILWLAFPAFPMLVYVLWLLWVPFRSRLHAIGRNITYSMASRHHIAPMHLYRLAILCLMERRCRPRQRKYVLNLVVPAAAVLYMWVCPVILFVLNAIFIAQQCEGDSMLSSWCSMCSGWTWGVVYLHVILVVALHLPARRYAMHYCLWSCLEETQCQWLQTMRSLLSLEDCWTE